ncbi:hypothetical protein MIR68_003893 [Amoeboaphelidium protococcarum]|nr:hypothetical protein MIR68_003893 [Amoeboaphelidium protococcarum]
MPQQTEKNRERRRRRVLRQLRAPVVSPQRQGRRASPPPALVASTHQCLQELYPNCIVKTAARMALLVDGIVPNDPATVRAAIDENKLLSGFSVEDEAVAPAAQQFVSQTSSYRAESRQSGPQRSHCTEFQGLRIALAQLQLYEDTIKTRNFWLTSRAGSNPIAYASSQRFSKKQNLKLPTKHAFLLTTNSVYAISCMGALQKIINSCQSLHRGHMDYPQTNPSFLMTSRKGRVLVQYLIPNAIS